MTESTVKLPQSFSELLPSELIGKHFQPEERSAFDALAFFGRNKAVVGSHVIRVDASAATGRAPVFTGSLNSPRAASK